MFRDKMKSSSIIKKDNHAHDRVTILKSVTSARQNKGDCLHLANSCEDSCEISQNVLKELEKLLKRPKMPENPRGFEGLGAMLNYCI